MAASPWLGHALNGITDPGGDLLTKLFARQGCKLEINARHLPSVNDSTAAPAAGMAALAGLGIVHTATVMAPPHFASGVLVPVRWTGAKTIPLCVVYPPNRHLSAKLRMFVAWVAELFARGDFIQRQCCMPPPVAADALLAAVPGVATLPDMRPRREVAPA